MLIAFGFYIVFMSLGDIHGRMKAKTSARAMYGMALFPLGWAIWQLIITSF